MNKSFSRRRSLALAAMVAGLAHVLPLYAQAPTPIAAWPAKPVRIVVNFPPGSSPDMLVRMISPPLQQALGQPVVVDNRAGASGIIGAEAVAHAEPDGHTLLMTAGSVITTNPHVFPKLPYDTEKDLQPVAALARLNLLLMTRGSFPASNAREFIEYLKRNPGKVTYGSAGNATGLHVAGEMFNAKAGTSTVHVPYKGASPALQDLLADQIDFYFDPGIAPAHARAGKLKVMAIAALGRSPLYPDVPTLDELGLKGFDAGTTHGLYAPAGTPKAVVERLNREVNAALALPAVRSQIAKMAAEPSPMSVAQFAALMKADSDRYGAVIRERKITVD